MVMVVEKKNVWCAQPVWLSQVVKKNKKADMNRPESEFVMSYFNRDKDLAQSRNIDLPGYFEKDMRGALHDLTTTKLMLLAQRIELGYGSFTIKAFLDVVPAIDDENAAEIIVQQANLMILRATENALLRECIEIKGRLLEAIRQINRHGNVSPARFVGVKK